MPEILKLELYHGTDDTFEEFDSSYTVSDSDTGALGYFSDGETVKIFGRYKNKYELEIDINKYKFKECNGYNEETYRTLVEIEREEKEKKSLTL